MQVRGAPRNLLPGDPLCAPANIVTIESTISLLRALHRNEVWTPHINSCLLERLRHIKALAKLMVGGHDDVETASDPQSPPPGETEEKVEEQEKEEADEETEKEDPDFGEKSE